MMRLAFTIGLSVLSFSMSALLAGEPTDKCKSNAPKIEQDLPLVFCDDFESGKVDRWAPSDPKAWRIQKQDGKFVYNQFQASKVKTPVRSPFNRSMIKDVTVSDFVFDVRLQSTIKDYGHRDMCLFFGFQDSAHFYYVHLGKKMDDHANQIFIVNGKPRTKISTKTTPGTNWDDAWHHARIERNAKTGDIRVYFDDMQKPVMTATDKTFASGQVGVGSFDDTGNFDNVNLFGTKVAATTAAVSSAAVSSAAVSTASSTVAVTATAAASVLAAVEKRAEAANVPPEGFTALFNGKDLTNWKGLVGNPKTRAKMTAEQLEAAQKKADESMRAHWKVVDGVIVFDGKGKSLCTAKDYGDFEFYVDFKIKEKGDSGIYLRGTPQVQIWDPKLRNIGSGGLFNNQKNPSKPLKLADNPVGEWNTFKIKMVGEKVTVHLNGVLVVDNVTLENYWERDKPIYSTGQIELQNHGNTLYFRNIYIREIPRK